MFFFNMQCHYQTSLKDITSNAPPTCRKEPRKNTSVAETCQNNWFEAIPGTRDFSYMHERASGLALGWDRSPLIGEDCIGLGAIDRGALFPF